MAENQVQSIRNIVLAGHGSTGKTTLVDAMLHTAKVTGRMGFVDEGTSQSDYDSEEKERKISISTSVLNIPWKSTHINVLDTPGYPEFIGEVMSSVRAVETMFVLVAAPNGLQLNSRKVFQLGREKGKSRFVVVNKMDGELIEYESMIDHLKEAFGPGCIQLNLPIGSSGSFKGVVNLLDGKPAEGLLADFNSARETLVESIVETDEGLMERYLEGEEVSLDELKAALKKGVARGAIVPIVHTAGRSELGVPELLDIISGVCPSPADVPSCAAKTPEGEPLALKASLDAAAAALVFKAVTDPYVGKICYFRVFSGRIAPDSQLLLVRTNGKVKPGHVYRVQGKETTEETAVGAGDIGAVAKVEDLSIGDALVDPARKVVFEDISYPVPLVALAIAPKSREDEKRLSGALAKLTEEDRTFVARRDKQTGELVASGMSSLHLDIMLAKLKRRFDVEVTTKEPKVPYFETLAGQAEGHYRHKKQTGGRGQFAEVYLRVEPRERGAGFEFEDAVVGGSIPNNFIPAVEKGVRERMARGVIAGCTVTDVKVSVYDGKFHDVDSSEAAFKIAGNRAFADAFERARPVLLEPVVNMEITIPSRFMGDVSGNINSRRGRIIGMESQGDMQVVRAEMPLAEVMNYSTELRSLTGGIGSYTMEFNRYEVLPPRFQSQIVEQLKRDQKEKEEEE